MRKCVICGNEVTTGAKKYCLKCKDEQYIKTRLKSQKAFFDKIDQLDPIRKCLKCGEVKNTMQDVMFALIATVLNTI